MHQRQRVERDVRDDAGEVKIHVQQVAGECLKLTPDGREEGTCGEVEVD